MKKRLDNLIANTGLATRSEAKKLIRGKHVTADGKIITDPAAKFDPAETVLALDGTPLQIRTYIYLMMNKPAGVVCATEDNIFSTVCDLLPERYQHFSPYPVGRLDKDTEGFVLLTNDGNLAHRVISPKNHVPKRYYAKIEGTLTQHHKELFAQGVTLEDGYVTMPAELFILSEGEIELIIYEGKFHQVKRMFEAIKCKVTYLKRLEIGPLVLDKNLALGEVRELSDKELEVLKNCSATRKI